MTYGLMYPHILIDIPRVEQKALPYMPHGKDMAMFSALIYIYIDIDLYVFNINIQDLNLSSSIIEL